MADLNLAQEAELILQATNGLEELLIAIVNIRDRDDVKYGSGCCVNDKGIQSKEDQGVFIFTDKSYLAFKDTIANGEFAYRVGSNIDADAVSETLH